MALSVDQLYLLNALSYMKEFQQQTFPNESLSNAQKNNPQTLGEIIATVQANLERNPDPSSQEYADHLEVCNRILKDQTLMDMTVPVPTHMNDSGAYSFVAIGGEPKEGVIVFEGTIGYNEWNDDFLGGGPTDAADGVSTPYQLEAQQWFENIQSQLTGCDQVTVTGHSKGGNKAKYLTLMDESGLIDRCVSFDAQGFSDEFMAKYGDRVAQQQNLITNFAAANDYVNILLNDVGEMHYIHTKTPDDPTLYHSLFTMMGDEKQTLLERECEQGQFPATMDSFLNSFLRSLSPEDKKQFLAIAGDLAGNFLADEKNSQDKLYALSLLGNGDAGRSVGLLLAFSAQYAHDHLEAKQTILSIFGAEIIDALQYIAAFIAKHPLLSSPALLAALLSGGRFKSFEKIRGMLSFLVEAAKAYAESYGKFDTNNGEDIYIPSAVSFKSDRIIMDSDSLRNVVSRLQGLTHEFSRLAGDVSRCTTLCSEQDLKINLAISRQYQFLPGGRSMVTRPVTALQTINTDLRSLSNETSELVRLIQRAIDQFESNENQLKRKAQTLPTG